MHFRLAVVMFALSLTATARAEPSAILRRLVIPLGDTSPTWSLMATADGRTVISRHNSFTLIWDAASKHQLASFHTGPSAIVKLCPSETCLLIVDGLRARVHRLDDQALVQEVRLDTPAVDAEMTADGLSVAIAVAGAVFRWDLRTNTVIPTGSWKRRVIRAISTAGDQVISGSRDGDLLLTTSDGQALHQTPTREGGVLGIKSAPSFAAVAYRDGVDILDAKLNVVAKLPFQAVKVCAMAVSSDSSLLGIATDLVLHIWDTRTWKMVRTVYPESSYSFGTCALAFVSNQRFVAAFSGAPREYPLQKPVPSLVTSINPEGGIPFFQVRPVPWAGANISFSPDGSRILTDSLMWDGRTGAVRRLTSRFGRETVCSVDRYRGWIAVQRSSGVEIENFNTRRTGAVDGSCSDFLPISPTGRLFALGKLPKGLATVWHPTGVSLVIGNGYEVVRVNAADRRATAFATDGYVTALAFSHDGRYLAVGTEEGGLEVWDYAQQRRIRRIDASDVWIGAVSWIDGTDNLITGDRNGRVVVWSKTGSKVAEIEAHDAPILSIAASKRDGLILTSSVDGRVKIWKLKGRALAPVLTLTSFSNGEWLAMTPQGHFDTSDLETMNFAYWKVGPGLRDILPVEAMMKEHFVPQLLAQTFAGARLTVPSEDRPTLSYVQPVVTILEANNVYDGSQTLEVKLSLSIPPGHSVHDLKIFAGGWLAAKIDGQIVGAEDEARTVEKKVRIPYRAIDITGRDYVSAYAFNAAGIKSETDRKPVFLPMPSEIRQKVTILSVGVNDYTDAAVRPLKFAAADAVTLNRALAASLTKAHPDASIVQRTLLSDGTERSATKAAFVSELRSLAAQYNADRSAEGGVPANDVLILTFAGHGYYQKGQQFSLMFADSQLDSKGTPINAVDISDLTSLLEDIFIGEITVIVDACHSASPISASDTPPSPLIGRGFAQLAYTKRIQYLGASQEAQFAMESSKLRHGFLSYALAIEGIQGRMADRNPSDGVIGLTELLEYAAMRVPSLSLGQSDQARLLVVGEGEKAFVPTAGAFGPQKPSLFDLTRGARDLIVEVK